MFVNGECVYSLCPVSIENFLRSVRSYVARSWSIMARTVEDGHEGRVYRMRQAETRCKEGERWGKIDEDLITRVELAKTTNEKRGNRGDHDPVNYLHRLVIRPSWG